MEIPLRPHEPGPDWKRERDVFDLYAAFQNIPQIDNLGPDPDTHSFPPDFAPKPASDASLAAFAQLAAIRLCAQRSMISLIDGQYQYILAEATPRTPLRANSSPHKDADILLGNVKIPRNWGLCELVLDPAALEDGDPGIIIVKDLSQSQQHSNRSYVVGEPHFKFYAGVPIRSPNGTVVGSMCIFDGPERSGMDQEDISYLQDLAATVMEYLFTYTLKDQHRRAAEGLHGLLTFAEADTKLKSTHEHYYTAQPSPEVLRSMRDSGYSEPAEESILVEQKDSVHNGAPQSNMTDSTTTEGVPERRKAERRPSVGDLQGTIVPNTMRELFARAADIMRKSNDMDGVVFLDTSIAARSVNGGDRPPSRMSERPCQILGFSMHDHSSYGNDSMPEEMIPKESNLAWLLKQYPQGYSLDCYEEQAVPLVNQESLSDDSSSPGCGTSTVPSPLLTPTALGTHISTVKSLFPNIKSAMFLPLWDFDRKRWFAGCFCWSTRAHRNLKHPRELQLIKAFGHSIMQEVARLDALETNQVKTTFLSSLSHELRSPLHGILGSVQLMRSTPLDSFQSAMVNSITVCGRTLLETVQHLLDHAERKEPSHNYSVKSFPKEHTMCITADSPPSNIASNTDTANLYCNVGLITEEVVETMFLGQARYDVSLGGEEIPGRPVDQSSSSVIARRRSRFIMVDIADYANLDFSIAASSYGRIVMNMLGNSLKFTESGYVLLSLRSERAEGSKVPVTLRICDSGIGISRNFLLNDLFEPFRKQNQHSAGTGVGLSVVKRIIEDIGGSIEVSSEVDKGTDITVKLLLERYKRPEDSDSPHGAIAAALSQLKSRKICLLHSKSPDANGPPEHLREWQTLKRYINALVTTLEVELKMDVTLTSEWNGHDDSDIVICPEVSFESLQTIREVTHRKPPATLFIAMDTMEADTLRCDARVTDAASVVEVVTQPCGPYKLGMVLSQCLSRYDSTDKVASDDMEPTPDHHLTANVNGSQLVSELGPRLGLYPSLPYQSKNQESQISRSAAVEEPPSLPKLDSSKSEEPYIPEDMPILIVDDNAINRRLLAAFMKKRKLAYHEAKDGLQALEKYKEAEGKFSVILMDISMPVMDGMTSTRLIREHEHTKNFTPIHIIALTGLTSASAQLEAWTSGVDDYLTKPVDFEKLQRLMKAGRGGDSTGFLNDQGREKTDEKAPGDTNREVPK
ncbi:hypothetical protein T440DRAFT_512793 [Plenodomus tracheiphilus IPT5]|uniref:histidine kinase n=1 Tax=Plenodomus tracheiphilus IPT5 TaxID=1408161 RepID=A0A6A7BQT4_9PLEO|nr:hypothetical protein T440DRAFT_512793 [Plenodomus tracheiphilus IPT5]